MGLSKEPRYWQSLEQLQNDPETLLGAQKEFLSSPLQEDEDKGGFERREFMKLMAAGTAMASLTACIRRPVQKIIPYVHASDMIIPGVPTWYASTNTENGYGVLVKTREGRPIKVEGNPDHPVSQGGTCARGQASVLDLYDADRAGKPLIVNRKGESVATTWGDLDKKAVEALRSAKRVRVLTGNVHSPSTKSLIKDFLSQFSSGTHVMYEPLGLDHLAEGQRLSYGTAVIPHYRFDKADVIVSLGADFLGPWLNQVEYNREFAKLRKLNRQNKKMSKLFVFESCMSLTGSNADVRYTVKPVDQLQVALAIAQALDEKKSKGGEGGIYSPETVSQKTGVPAQAIRAAAEALWANRGRGLVVAADVSNSGPMGVRLEVVASFINSLCGNEGVTVESGAAYNKPVDSYRALAALTAEMNAGQVDVLIINGTNPVFSAPAALKFAEALGKVKIIISTNDRVDETSSLADYLAPDNHWLESWNDAEPRKGIFSITQPTIQALNDTRQFQDSLLVWAKGLGAKSAKVKASENFHDYVQGQWKDVIFKDAGRGLGFQGFWEQALRDGSVDLSSKHARGGTRSFKAAALDKVMHAFAKSAEGFQLVLFETVSQGDGRHGNNAWMQELPDPVTKMTWENYAAISPRTAQQLGVKNGDLLNVKVQSVSHELPAYIQPGMADQTVAIPVGWGRKNAGRVGNGRGTNAFEFVDMVDDLPVFMSLAADVKKTGGFRKLACTQTHFLYDEHDKFSTEKPPGESQVIREASLQEFLKNPAAGNEEKESAASLWPSHEYKGYRWGMAIDLNSCTGCSACVIACQSENNIPVVGQDQVRRGREMHWLRIDRYYSGDKDNPQTVHQPMLCQHCENAPCETVCPVVATTHSDEGLNEQIYNRCVGTRYCSNNCPYKVRRFNWFNFSYYDRDGLTIPAKAWNPDVSVRFRGVMEKCTFCIQRIKESKNIARDQGTTVKDKDLKTACQQGCPTEAIVFGNINDPESAVSQFMKTPRAYHVLGELNVKPSISYLTKIRNVDETSHHEEKEHA